VSKSELPRETQRQPLDYLALISTLDAVSGEPVVVTVRPREADQDRSAQGVSIVGELRHEVSARYEDHEFSIGSPYAERYPEHLAGGVFFLCEQTFRSGVLTTFDGNDYFIIAIETRDMRIVVQDSDSGAP
jgi:hypothetical protein